MMDKISEEFDGIPQAGQNIRAVGQCALPRTLHSGWQYNPALYTLYRHLLNASVSSWMNSNPVTSIATRTPSIQLLEGHALKSPHNMTAHDVTSNITSDATIGNFIRPLDLSAKGTPFTAKIEQSSEGKLRNVIIIHSHVKSCS